MTESGTSTIRGTKAPYVVAALVLAEPVTSRVMDVEQAFNWFGTTTSSLPRAIPTVSSVALANVTAREGIQEIKRLSGLTWDELGKVFCVSRRSVHNWARGESVTADHEAKIQAVLEKVRRIDHGAVRLTASRLRSSVGDAPLYLQLAATPLASLETLISGMPTVRDAGAVDEATLMANWRPIAPFRGRWEDEPIEDVVPIGNYPVKRLKVAIKRQS